MTLIEFRKKLLSLHEKSEMDEVIHYWPFVYDIDEEGKIFVDEDGVFYFSDTLYNWVKSHLLLSDVVNLRFDKSYEESSIDLIDSDNPEVSNSSIYIYFASGERIWLFNWHESCTVHARIKLIKNDANADTINKLREFCSCRELEFSIN